MKKLLLIIALAVFGIHASNAQEAFQQKDLVLNVGIGFGNTLHSGNGWKTSIPPISASVEYCIKDNLFDDKSSIGIGGILGFAGQKYDKYGLDLKYTDIVIAARGAFHYQFIPKLDTYAGLGIGYDILSTSGSFGEYSADSSSFFIAAYVGARYYFTNNFAVMSELGYDIGVFKIGIAYKF